MAKMCAIINFEVLEIIISCLTIGLVAYPRDNRDGGDDGAAYNSIQLNSETQNAPAAVAAAAWPTSQRENEIMFVLPRQLNYGDKISVSGTLRSDRQRFTVNLVTGSNSPDYSNVTCQFEAQFNQENRVILKRIQNGSIEEISGELPYPPASDWFTSNDFKFTFELVNHNDSENHLITVSIGDSHLEHIELKHRIEDIRFLTLEGDIKKVDKLELEFA